MATNNTNETEQIYKFEEVQKHKTEKSAWIIIHGIVYDVTKFLEEHPGGSEILLDSCGNDSSEEFDNIGHSRDAIKMLEKYVIGKVEDLPTKTVEKSSKSCNIL